MIFGHFNDFGHFSIEIPIEAKKCTHMGRKGRTAKTKTALEPVNQGAKQGSKQNWILKRLKKNPPTVKYYLANSFRHGGTPLT